MKTNESRFLKSKGTKSEKSQIRLAFKSSQGDFDKLLKKRKNTFSNEQQLILLKSRIENPRLFWSSISSLIRYMKTSIPLQVYTDDGLLSDDLSTVLMKWQSDYETLYNNDDNMKNDFFVTVSNVLYEYELHICDNIHVENVLLNEQIGLYEVEKQ